MEKAALRRKFLAGRMRMTTREVCESSRSVFKTLAQERIFLKAKNICCYLSFDNEVHTHGFILKCLKVGKTVVVPKVDKKKGILLSKLTDFNHLSSGPFGILEPEEGVFQPFDSAKLDLAIIPAVALDCKGNRLGFGFGYYDKFLAQNEGKLFLVGVAHDFQLVERLPVCVHDIAMHQVITNRENIRIDN